MTRARWRCAVTHVIFVILYAMGEAERPCQASPPRRRADALLSRLLRLSAGNLSPCEPTPSQVRKKEKKRRKKGGGLCVVPSSLRIRRPWPVSWVGAWLGMFAAPSLVISLCPFVRRLWTSLEEERESSCATANGSGYVPRASCRNRNSYFCGRSQLGWFRLSNRLCEVSCCSAGKKSVLAGPRVRARGAWVRLGCSLIIFG